MKPPYPSPFLIALFGLILTVSLVAEETTDFHTPPPLTLDKLINAPTDEIPTWETLKGNVVVLEFWATWCAPCILEIPHINEMVDHFKDRTVQFISITNEEESVVRKFLERKPMHGWIGLDRDNSISDALAQVGLPGMVIIDQEGKLVAQGHPARFTKRHIENILAGEPIEKRLRPTSNPEMPQTAETPTEPVYQILVEPSNSSNAGSLIKPGHIAIRGGQIQDMLSFAYGMGSTRITIEDDLPEERYDITINLPTEDLEHTKTVFRETLERSFGLAVEKALREKDVYALKVKKLNPDHIQPTAITGDGRGISMKHGNIQIINFDFTQFGEAMEHYLDKPVIDQTGNPEHFDVSIPLQAAGITFNNLTPEAFIEVLQTELGLEVIPTSQEIEMLVVRRS